MKEKKKLNRVSWAPGSELCQVKLIQKADPPPKVGQKMPNNPPPPKVGPKMPNIPKPRKPSHFPTSCPSAYVPFKKESNMNQPKDKLPRFKWEIPPSFALEFDWLVASGEESEETKVQKLRESNVPEAVYPHICAIPPSPSIPSDVEEEQCLDDSQTPVIPIIPIEEADSSAPAPVKTLDSSMLLSKSFLPPNPCNDSKSAPVEGDTLLAAVAAATAIMKSMDPGSMIDTDLLVKYLRDPELTLQLINEHRLAANNVSGPYKSKMLEPCNTEPGRKAIEQVSAPLLTKPSDQPTKTATGLTKPLDQPTKTASGEKDQVGKSGQEPLTQFRVTKTGTAGGGSIIDLPSKKFIGAQSQLEMVKSEMFKILNPIISSHIVAGSGLEPCFTFNPQQKPDSPPIMQTEKTSSEQCHQIYAENIAPTFPRPLIHSQGENAVPSIPRPLIHSLGENITPTIQRPLIHSQGERTYGTGFAPGPHIMHTDNAATVQLQCHMNNTEKVAFAIPRSLTHTVVGGRTYETGLTTPGYTFSNYASGRREPVATSGLVPEKQQVPQPRLPAGGLYMNSELKDTLSNYASGCQEPVATSGFVTEKQQVPQPRLPAGLYMNSELKDTFSNYASGLQEPVATSGLVTVKQHDPQPRLPAGLHMNSELKDEHGGHDHVAKAHAVRIHPTVGNPSQPNLSVFKRMIRDYGLPDNCNGSEPPLAIPKDYNSARPAQHSSVFGAPAFSGNKTDVPQLKYFSYYQFLSKQQGDTQNSCWDHHQPSPPHITQSSNIHIYKPKNQETCSYFDTARRCRNGSTCLFRHEAFDQKRPMATTHEASPDAKRLKLGLGREIIGRT